MASTAIVIMGGFDQAIPEKTPIERLPLILQLSILSG
jgi:hypothetical protein